MTIAFSKPKIIGFLSVDSPRIGHKTRRKKRASLNEPRFVKPLTTDTGLKMIHENAKAVYCSFFSVALNTIPKMINWIKVLMVSKMARHMYRPCYSI